MCLTTPTTPAAMLNVQVTSHETIRPSSPTPPHLRSMPLSVGDQLAPVIYIQVLLFFFHAPTTAKAALILKESLSKTLTHFYHLAGRLCEDFASADVHVVCNDEGAEFHEATAEGPPLDVILGRPPMGELSKLMPNGGANVKRGDPLLAVQLNAFGCGGVALGVCISHQVADAASLALFLNSWAEVARGEEQISSPPRFHTASVFPPADLPQPLVHPKDDGLLPNRFVIRGPEVDKLRHEAAYERAADPIIPTRFEAVAALLWRCIIRARPSANNDHDERRIPVALIPVNLRKKMPAELSDHSFGNLLVFAAVVDHEMPEKGSGKDRQAFLEGSIRGAITSVDRDFVNEQVEGLLSGQSVIADDSVDTMEFSSWCKLSVYRTDFGWGEPVWFCSLMRDVVNLTVLADTRDGGGMEVWTWLPEEEMGRLQSDPELLEFIDPLSICY